MHERGKLRDFYSDSFLIFDEDTDTVWLCPSRTCSPDIDGVRTGMLWLAANAAHVVTQPDQRCNAGPTSVQYPPLWQPVSWRNNPVLSSHSNGATGDGVEHGEGAPEPPSKYHGKTTIFFCIGMFAFIVDLWCCSFNWLVRSI